jgi:dTDP-4-dehydrorhamnose 3,5-epimerase
VHFKKTPIGGAWTIEPSPHVDGRGSFFRAWCINEFTTQGIEFTPLQTNIGVNRRAGTLRGLHYQAAPHDEAKLVRCTRGAVFDVIVDLRQDSPTFGHWFGTELTAANARMILAPRGCAHGYQVLQDESDVFYMTSAVYEPSAVRGLKYDDPTVGIEWPLPPVAVSDQDKLWPSMQDYLQGASR